MSAKIKYFSHTCQIIVSTEILTSTLYTVISNHLLHNFYSDCNIWDTDLKKKSIDFLLNPICIKCNILECV